MKANKPPTTWLSEQRVNGTTVARIGRRGIDVLAELGDAGTLVANSIERSAHFESSPSASPTLIAKVVDSKVDALVRHLNGKLTLHGAAACLGSSAVAILGPSGAGKSTLIAALCLWEGFALLADDTVSIELTDGPNAEVRVIPTQESVWLLPGARRALAVRDAAHGKCAVTLKGATHEEFELRGVVCLEVGTTSQPKLHQMRGQEAFRGLVSSVIRLLVDDPDAQAREFDQLKTLVCKCPVFRLSTPRNFDLLHESVGLVRMLTRAPDVHCLSGDGQ